MNSRLPHLTSELIIQGKSYKNRITAAPMGASASPEDGAIPDFVLSGYNERAKGGCAAVCVGETHVPGIYADRLGEFPPTDYTKTEGPQSDGWRRYSSGIHENGALALIELAHGGAVRDIDDELDPAAIGPMDLIRSDGRRVAAIDESMMRQIADDFALAAGYMKKCGFDGVMVHAGHGWLPHQFLSTTFNLRTDEYGGSAENRARFPIAIIRRMREIVGVGFIIEVRVSCSEVTKDGLDKEVLLALAKGIDGYADIMHFSSGLYDDPHITRMWSTMYDDHFCNLPVAEHIKKNTDKLFISVVGGINSPEEADRYIGEGRIDLIALGRQVQNADPEFGNKCMEGREWDINRCLRCLQCNGGMGGAGDADDDDEGPAGSYRSPNRGARGGGAPPPHGGDSETPPRPMPSGPKCTVNPMSNTDFTQDSIPKAGVPKKVLVIGGGVAGMQAAIVAADRGNSVTLADSGDRLGGILRFTDADLHKTDLKNHKDLLIKRVELRGVKVLLNSRADRALIESEKPDAIICAVGSSPVIPPIPGIEDAIKALDYYLDAPELGGSVLMVGGGLVGCETALNIADSGRNVSIIEMLPKAASDTSATHRRVIRRQLKNRGIAVYGGHRVTRIEANGLYAEDGAGAEVFFPADSIIYAVGMRSNTKTVEELRESSGDIPFFTVGDCDKVQRVGHAGVAACKAALAI